MFEVEEHEKYVDIRNACYRKRSEKNKTISYFTGFDDGAEFGYNKAKKEMEGDDNSCETCRHKEKMLTDKKPCKDCDNGCNWEK